MKNNTNFKEREHVRIADVLVAAFINDDWSGIDATTIQQAESFGNQYRVEMPGDTSKDFSLCAVTGLMGNTINVPIVPIMGAK